MYLIIEKWINLYEYQMKRSIPKQKTSSQNWLEAYFFLKYPNTQMKKMAEANKPIS